VKKSPHDDDETTNMIKSAETEEETVVLKSGEVDDETELKTTRPDKRVFGPN
jgi:hypothetical protein